MISDILPRYQEVANGSKKAFTVPFDTLDSSYINVYLNNTKQTSGYTVSNKVVTFTSAPANGTVVTVTRVIPIEWEQEVLGAINQDSLNKIFTKLVAQMQTLKEEVSRAVKTNVTDTESGNDHFLELLEDAIDSLELANTKLEQVIASGTQALSDIDSAKTGALAQIESKVDEAEGWAETAQDWAESVNPENFDHLKGKISNCILEIPQNVKLEINTDNNIINIALGSTLVIPNGDTYTTSQTTTYPSKYTTILGSSPSNKYLVFFWKSGSGCDVIPVEGCFSGTTQPATTYLRSYWYNTTDKYLYKTTDTGATWSKLVNAWSFPVCVVEINTNNKLQFAKDSNGNDMIFNGLGFIGQTKFLLPGVKVLETIGKNPDGSLKSKEITNNTLQLVTQGGTYNRKMYLRDSVFQITNSAWYYDEDKNLWYDQNNIPCNSGCVLLGNSFTVNDLVTDFTISQPYEGAANLLTRDLEKKVDTNTSDIAQNTADIALKANDSDVVKLTGNQNIDGTKKFITPVTRSDRTIDFDGTTYPVSINSYRIEDSKARLVGSIYAYKEQSYTDLWLRALNPLDNSFYADLRIRTADDKLSSSLNFTPHGSGNVNLPLSRATTASNDTEIPLKGWCNTPGLSNIMHLTDNETVAGEKTFTSIPTFKHDASAIRLLNPNATKGTAPSSNKYGYVEYLDKNGSGNANRIGLLEFSQKPNGDTVTLIAAYKDVEGGTERAEIDIVMKSNGTAFASCPTPAATAHSNEIITAEWVTNNTEEVIVVDDSNVSGTEWYKVWSNGWVEQGGVASLTADSGQTITFLKPFADNKYTMIGTAEGANRYDNICITSKTATRAVVDPNTAGTYDWFACGMGA